MRRGWEFLALLLISALLLRAVVEFIRPLIPYVVAVVVLGVVTVTVISIYRNHRSW
jgi:CHASE2 domain-containing sensor protein